jgi:hypothetical protein
VRESGRVREREKGRNRERENIPSTVQEENEQAWTTRARKRASRQASRQASK